MIEGGDIIFGRGVIIPATVAGLHLASQRCLLTQSHLPTITAAAIPANWATMKAVTPDGAMPAKVSDSARAMVTAGLANEVEAVNQ